MTRMNDEAVEAGARAIAGHRYDDLSDRSKEAFRDETRAAITAALPHLEGATPAIDREALQRLIDNAEHYDTCSYALNPSAGYECSCLLADLRALIGRAS